MYKKQFTLKKEQQYKRGDMVLCDLGVLHKHYSTQFGTRPCIIISNDIGNLHAPVITVVPMTTRPKATLPTHTHIEGNKEYSLVLCEQAVTIDKIQIKEHLGHVSTFEMKKIDSALKVALAL